MFGKRAGFSKVEIEHQGKYGGRNPFGRVVYSEFDACAGSYILPSDFKDRVVKPSAKCLRKIKAQYGRDFSRSQRTINKDVLPTRKVVATTDAYRAFKQRLMNAKRKEIEEEVKIRRKNLKHEAKQITPSGSNSLRNICVNFDPVHMESDDWSIMAIDYEQYTHGYVYSLPLVPRHNSRRRFSLIDKFSSYNDLNWIQSTGQPKNNCSGTNYKVIVLACDKFKLDLQLQSSVPVVTGISMISKDRPSHSESFTSIKRSDVLLAINEKSVKGCKLVDIYGQIQTSSRPITLHFQRRNERSSSKLALSSPTGSRSNMLNSFSSTGSIIRSSSLRDMDGLPFGYLRNFQDLLFKRRAADPGTNLRRSSRTQLRQISYIEYLSTTRYKKTTTTERTVPALQKRA